MSTTEAEREYIKLRDKLAHDLGHIYGSLVILHDSVSALNKMIADVQPRLETLCQAAKGLYRERMQ